MHDPNCGTEKSDAIIKSHRNSGKKRMAEGERTNKKTYIFMCSTSTRNSCVWSTRSLHMSGRQTDREADTHTKFKRKEIKFIKKNPSHAVDARAIHETGQQQKDLLKKS